MEKLESLSEKDNLSSVGLSLQLKESANDKWTIIPGQADQSTPSAAVETNGCLSPNGFQVLQSIREEGEIDDDKDKEQDEAEKLTDEVTVNDAEVDITEKTLVANQRQNSSQRSRGRGSKKAIVNSRALFQAISQQQNGPNTRRKKSFFSEAVMSSIFAWNMRGFN